MLGPVGRVERRHSGHGVDQHAGRADLRARADHRLRPRAAAACRRSRSRWSSTPRRTATARWTRRRCWPASAGRTSASSPTRRAVRDACRTRWTRRSPPTGAPAPSPAPSSPPTGTTTTTALDPIAADRRRSPRSTGLWLHVDAAMAGSAMILPECRADVGRRRGRRLARRQPAQVAGRGVRLLAVLRPRRRAPRARDVDQPELPAVGRRRPGEEPSRLGHPARPPLPRAEAVVPDPRAGRRRACRRGCAATWRTRGGSPTQVRAAPRLARARAGAAADAVRPARAGRARRRGARSAHAGAGPSA